MKSIENANISVEKKGNLTLLDYFKRLSDKRISEKSSFVKEIARRCDISEGTVYNWIYGRSIPQKESYCKILSEATGIPADKMFSSR